MSRHECDCGEVYSNLEQLYHCQANNHYQLQYCHWGAHDEFYDEDPVYYTECGQEFVFRVETPKINGYKYCPSCGQKIRHDY